MHTAELNLTEHERSALQEISRLTGKPEVQLIREAIDQFISHYQVNDRLLLMRKAKGIWKDHQDLPDLEELRTEWERF